MYTKSNHLILISQMIPQVIPNSWILPLFRIIRDILWIRSVPQSLNVLNLRVRCTIHSRFTINHGITNAQLWMHQTLLIKQWEKSISGPVIESFPIRTFSVDFEVGPWATVIGQPVVGYDAEIWVALYCLAEVFEAMVLLENDS